MAERTPFMPLWVGDFLKDTQDLDAAEVGAYMLILMAMWSRNGRLQADERKLKRVARAGRNWPRVWEALQPYFQERDGHIYNKRLTLELQKVNTKREVNAQSGARGGRAKALKEKEARLANATNSLWQSESYSENTPTPTVPPSDCARATTDPPAKQPQQDKPVSQQKPTPAVEPDDDQLLADVMKAVGLDGHEGHHYWLPPTSTIHVGKWRRDLGLTYHQILAAAKESRKRHTEPPRGPKALDGVMKAMASVIHAPPMTPAANAPPKPGKWRNIAAQFEAQDPTRRAAT